MPLNLSRGSWQHICVSWSQKGGAWQAYQGGKLRGEGHALAAGHHIRPGGVFILGQEQVSPTSVNSEVKFQVDLEGGRGGGGSWRFYRIGNQQECVRHTAADCSCGNFSVVTR